MLMRIL